VFRWARRANNETAVARNRSTSTIYAFIDKIKIGFQEAFAGLFFYPPFSTNPNLEKFILKISPKINTQSQNYIVILQY
jgi:hypothetical protein